ncbi:Serine protease, subtilisin family [Micromonospora rhizosphaerae]|uniref:Serine protease, subtilisin family n=1 Tax=Micromonospora rhizosphaerae TaxID=568872 RepID=A0A1C6SR92_9ACTN|nr:carboxypeptidase regulatory-like domain-containing protein [Micromonospora rhizosphaerae]SCL31872.1 Serine protease, subtilisin family [Micromonospora rhizosphaerae]
MAALLVVAMVAAVSAIGSPAAADSLDKVEKKVLEQTAGTKQATFWAVLRDKADLGRAAGMQDRNARGKFVMDQLKRTADQSQAGLLALLKKRGVKHQRFWITNTVRVTAGQSVLKEIAADPGVERVLADRTYHIPDPKPNKEQPEVNAVEWNIDRIHAPQVWSTFGIRGEGIVVANIDTGVQFDHPALVAHYRGNQGGGNFDHNYNWFDPSNVCGSPSLAPCDNADHGTHTMGTMVGDDGEPGPNQIGVAPGARWIAAKGCESFSCSLSALLASGEWVLAPTDLNGQNPRPDLRPHIVNNSWGGGGGDPFYQAIVNAWVASGIFPAFSNGNSGPGCNSSGSPGDYIESYSAGAFDIGNNIADFSSRGPSGFNGEPKPNIAAPGVAVRSSVPPNSYASFDGTSMASPHVAATVALMWSAAATLVGDIAGTRALLDSTAIDTSDLSCGGTDADNNVWGEGRLDAFAAVDQSPRGPVGTLSGTVTNAADGSPISGATIRVAGPADRTTATDANGRYTMVLPVGTYEVTATAFGFRQQAVSGLVISEGATTIQDLALQPAPSHAVSGQVRNNDGEPVANATVTVLGKPIAPATTDANGGYSFPSVPEGEYDVRAAAGGCSDQQEQHLVVDGDETLDFTLPQRRDEYGYFCQVSTPGYLEADTVLPLSGDDQSTQVDLPFPFSFYGQTYETAHVSTNGLVNFLGPNSEFFNTSIPSTAAPNAAIYPYWDDLVVDGAASVRTQVLGSAPARTFVIEWRNVTFFGDSSHRMDFEVVLHENGRVQTEYRNIDNDGWEKGNSATIGIENESGNVALQYSFNAAAIGDPTFAVLYRLPPSGFVQGTVTDANDHQAVAGATVRALQNGSVVRSTTTNAAGSYRMQLSLGTYTIEATATNYTAESAEVVLDEQDEVATRDFVLRTARAEVAPGALEFIVPPGQTRTRVLTLRNTGSRDMTWEAAETGGGKVTTGSTNGLPKNPEYNPNARNTKGLYAGKAPSGWSPTAPGDVIRSWVPSGLSLAWGVGFTGDVWLSDVPDNNRNHEFSVTGTPTGRNWPAPGGGEWPADMAYDAGRGVMCQLNVGGDNGIHCWNPNTGAEVGSITGSFPWTSISQRGLAYRPDDDTFYVGGWNEGILYHIKGLSHPDKGAVISQCSPPDGNISGLAWNGASNIVWAATNSETDTVYQLDPANCAVLSTLPHPSPGFGGAGLELDSTGNLWMIDQDPNRVYLIESGVPNVVDVPWLSEDPASGTVAPGATQPIRVSVDTTGLTPGTYSATMLIQTNSGRQPRLEVPVRLVVPAYYQAVNAGGGGYTDLSGDLWSADQRYSPGSWGYTSSQSRVASTARPISGTEEDPLYQDLRQDPVEYRFDGLPAGVYEVDLRFAEVANRQPNTRLYDVIVEGGVLLPAHDTAAEVGSFAADQHVFYVQVTDGQLNIRFVGRRGYAPPIVNGIQVIHRPDR